MGVWRLMLAGVLLVAGSAGPVHAQIATDGTVGSLTTLSGPDFSIPHTLGTQTGSNLFHSFQTFNIQTGESATFTGPGGLDNVISRVTGGQESQINGVLRSTIPGADFWFLNPAGVMFGQGSEVDVPGSLHVGTGDEIQFDDGAVFNATTPSLSTLTVASPEAFGFLGSNPGAIGIDQTTLQLVPGETLSLFGGDITVNDALIATGEAFTIASQPNGGTINLVSVSSPNVVSVVSGTSASVADGTITVTRNSNIDASGNGGGTVRIQSGTFVIDDSAVRATNYGNFTTGEGISLSADVIRMLNGTIVTATTLSSGNAVPITIVGDAIDLDNAFISTSSNATFEDVIGDASDISITASNFTLTNDTFITSGSVFGSNGDGGAIVIQADTMSMTDSSSISSSSNFTDPDATGDAGSIDITVGNLFMQEASIGTDTGGQGNGGVINIVADRIEMGVFASIAADSGGFDNLATGDSGDINITVGELFMSTASISSNTQAFGEGGSIVINAGRMELELFSQIDSNSTSFDESIATGDAGNITVTAGELILDISTIESNTVGPGDGGLVSVTADTVLITNQGLPGSFSSSGLASRARPGSTGNAGSIQLSAGTVTLIGGGSINSSTTGSGSGGSVFIDVDRLEVLSASNINSSTFDEGDAGILSVTADEIVIDTLGASGFNGIVSQSSADATGDAGEITIDSTNMEVRGGSLISSSTFGSGDAGSITADVETLILSGDGAVFFTGITSNANFASSTGDAGIINITADSIEMDDGGIRSQTDGAGDAGQVTVTAGQINMIGGSAIDSSTFGAGDAGTVIVNADDLVISANGSPFFSGIASAAVNPGFDGNAGEVFVTAGSIQVLDSSEISSSTSSEGNAGSVTIEADSLLVSGQGTRVASETFAQGDAGQLVLDIGELEVRDRALVSSTTIGSGLGGSISLTADTIVLDNGSLASGTVSEAPGAGDGGSLAVTAGDIQILNGGLMTVSTRSTGDGGSVSVDADSITIEGSNDEGQVSQIDSQTFVSGEAGSVFVTADSIDLSDGGRIVGSTTGMGTAGSVNVTVGDLTISGARSGLSSDSAFGAQGDAGSVTVSAETIDISNGAIISTSVLNPGRAASGSVTVTADDISLSSGAGISTSNNGRGLGGDISITATNIFSLSDARVTTTAATGDGGRITLSGGVVDQLNSEISTSVGGAGGDGGDINISNTVLVQDNSTIRANAFGGDGGNITITVEQLIQHPVRAAIIEATSALGISGDINVSTPETDAVGGIVVLSGDFLENTVLLDEPCATRIGEGQASSLVPAGRGGLPATPDDPATGFYFAPNPGTAALGPRLNSIPVEALEPQLAVRIGCDALR